MTFCTVALLSPPFSSLTYAVPDWLSAFKWQPGLRVVIPLGKGPVLRPGVILDTTGKNLPAGVTARPMLWPLEKEPLLPPGHMEMVRQLALRQAVTPGQILAAVLPSGLRLTHVRLRWLDGKGKANVQRIKALYAASPADRLSWGKAWMEGKVELLLPSEDAAASELCLLQQDPPWQIRPAAIRQLAILEWLFEHGAVSRREIIRQLGRESIPALEALLRHGLVALQQADQITPEEPGNDLLPPSSHSLIFSRPQQEALDDLRRELTAKKPTSHLLFGVTGSGKTAVYLGLIRECVLIQKRSALLLAPEVALALKLRRDAQAALPELALYFFHGYQTARSREETFRSLAHRNTPCLVVGTRSALFLPIPDLGVIILDEEHDASFKQDEGLPYQAKEVAWFRTVQIKGLLVLGSATPDLKTFHAAREAKIPMSMLPSRVGGGRLPEIQLVDIRTIDLSETLLAPESLKALQETVQRGEQVVILLNRRGYAPLMYCLDCGKAARCPHCDIALTYHKGRERLVCHYCGHTVPFPSPCSTCKGLHYLPMGQGTERIEEHISTLLPPGGKVLRLDRDTTRRPGNMERILEAFARQEAQVLVGTQMLSKGHHFPQVTLAIIADGDLGLNLPDYRAAERTFQLLVQSAGRAGRGEKPGRVLIQTRDTEHYCWKFVREGDYIGFYEQEIALRQRRKYPPFTNLALIRISYAMEWKDGPDRLSVITAQLRAESREKGVTVLGPAPAPLSLLRGRKRFQCLLKADNWQAIRALYATVQPLAIPPHLRISLDIDPVNML